MNSAVVDTVFDPSFTTPHHAANICTVTLCGNTALVNTAINRVCLNVVSPNYATNICIVTLYSNIALTDAVSGTATGIIVPHHTASI